MIRFNSILKSSLSALNHINRNKLLSLAVMIQIELILVHLIGRNSHVSPASIPVIMIAFNHVEITRYPHAPSLQSLSSLQALQAISISIKSIYNSQIFSINHLLHINQIFNPSSSSIQCHLNVYLGWRCTQKRQPSLGRLTRAGQVDGSRITLVSRQQESDCSDSQLGISRPTVFEA